MEVLRSATHALVLLLACLLVCLTVTACTNRAPATQEVYDEVVALIEASHTVNDLAFGAGLPVWDFDSEFAKENHLYRDSDDSYYQYVTDDAPFGTILQMREAVEAVYSEDYARALCETLFDGFALGTTIVRPQYIENNGWLMQRTEYEPIITARRVYDYPTMRVVRPSDRTHLTVEIESRIEGQSEVSVDKLHLVLEENGWRLDTPTY